MTTLLLMLAAVGVANADTFGHNFDDQTLRFDISLSAADRHHHIGTVSIDSISTWPGWYGRRVNLKRELSPEIMVTCVTDAVTGDTLYLDSKSPAESEEFGTPTHTTVLVPKPKRPSHVRITSYDTTGPDRHEQMHVQLLLTERDLMALQPRVDVGITPYVTLRHSTCDDQPIHIAIVAEGYKTDEMDAFLQRAAELDSTMFAEKAFGKCADRFEVVAVMLPSQHSGVSVPSAGVKVGSALQSHFDSYGLERLLTVPDTRLIWDALEGVPAWHVMIIANSDKYGGSGTYNEYAIASAGSTGFAQVLLHEFGHSFRWLGDEYESGYTVEYTSDYEPIEPNITTLHDFSHKWQNLIDAGEASLIEGAGYQSKGVWRGCEHCLMRAIQDRSFCAVCTQALMQAIDYFTMEITAD